MATDMATGMATDTVMKSKVSKKLPAFGILLFCYSALGTAQMNNNLPGAISGTSTANASPATSGAVSAQNSPQEITEKPQTLERTWAIKPRVSLTETLTDNANVNASSGKQSDLITELAPGVRIEARTARVKAYFDYELRGQFYAKSDYSRTQNSLNTFGTLEAVDKWLFLDFSGLIAQQAISAFGPQSPGNTTINRNSTETATYRLSPYIRGQLGGLADYLLRYNASTTRADSSAVSDMDLSQWNGQLKGSTPFKNLKWSIDGDQQTVKYSRGRETDAEIFRGSAIYALMPELRISLSAGRESNNYASIDQESSTTSGYGFDWNPTERTQISAFKERRFFGDGHRFTLSHRFPMSSIGYTDTRDVSVMPNQFATAGMGTVYDQFYPQFSQICIQQFGGTPSQSQINNCVLNLFGLLGIQPNTQVTGGFMTTRATVQRLQQLSLAIFGVRNTLTILANRTENESMLASSQFVDIANQSSVVRQEGLSLTFSHRLSELSNLNVLASRQQSTGSGFNNIKTTSTLYQVNVSTKLGAKTMGSVSLRRSEFDSNTNPFTENALLGTLSYIY